MRESCDWAFIATFWTAFNPFSCYSVLAGSQRQWTLISLNQIPDQPQKKKTITLLCLKKRLWTKLLKCTPQITLFLFMFLLPVDLIESWHSEVTLQTQQSWFVLDRYHLCFYGDIDTVVMRWIMKTVVQTLGCLLWF